MPFSVLGKASLYFSRFALRSHCTPYHRYERGAEARLRFLCSFSLTQRRRRFAQPVYGLRLLTVRFPVSSAVECISIAEARQHIGEDQCVSGKAVRVKHAGRGVTLFDFCQDSMVCPFTVVVIAHDLKRIGDVSQLQNKVIEVHGPVKEYDGRAEIVLQQLRQLGGEGLGIPRLPKPAYTAHKKKANGKDSDRCPAPLRFD
jgi:hypothetical protein